MKRGVYLDYNATTPLLPQALEAMLPFFTERFGNAASPHLWGKDASDAVEEARHKLAQLLGAIPQEIFFTSGATEALNLALFGLAEAYASTGRRHILVSPTEHKAVLDPLKVLSLRGWSVDFLPVDENGLISPSDLRKALRQDTLVVAIMLANNETGVIQPVSELSAIAHEKGAFFLCDTTQAVGKIPVSLPALGVDIAVLSAHKFYGPKGIGALYLKRRSPRVNLQPILFGGGHERGLRSGTLPVPLIVGMSVALEIVMKDLPAEASRQSALRDLLRDRLLEIYPSARENGAAAPRLPNTLSMSFPGLKASDILARTPLLGAATGSACSSARPEPSHVLLAMGCSPELARSTLRFSVGRFTTAEDIEVAVEYLSTTFQSLSPRGKVLS
ncbi:MAG: cysteine desulfurase [Bacteroidia bacterium]|nr:cysteine desulfurase [Bacteroidia bacterium]MCX7764022.1 cysteine desulfurase [Bacteroidia bacterium]MDW8058114.1 cysteine desulfurase family protein [Bacteroidia bacterium]